MITFKKAKELSKFIIKEKKQGKSIGFTPTMGALHEGHLSLIERSMEENDISICSIFVNPTQFNVKADLEKYPRTGQQDVAYLQKIGCDILFLPEVKEIYPEGSNYKIDVDLNGLDLMMEGSQRPGHFDGVVQVVKRLLDITNCDRLYMGQKDFQQFTIIGQMIENLELNVQLIICPILRDEDGLAKSSRNRRLSADDRSKASIIFRVLNQAREWLHEGRSPIEISMKAMEYLDIPNFRPEYFDLIDGKTMARVSSTDQHDIIVACTAVWAGEIRLIDNMILKGGL